MSNNVKISLCILTAICAGSTQNFRKDMSRVRYLKIEDVYEIFIVVPSKSHRTHELLL